MVGMMKHAVKRSATSGPSVWEEALLTFLYDDRRSNRNEASCPFQLMYGIDTRILTSYLVAFLSDLVPHHCLVENLSDYGTRVAMVENFSIIRKAK